MRKSAFVSQFFLGFLLLTSFALSQTMILEPPRGFNSGSNTPVIKVFYGTNSQMVLKWTKNLSGTSNRFRVGSSPGNYGLGSVNVLGTTGTIIPGGSPLNLPVGRYYGLITNSTQTTLAGIQANYNSNPGTIDYSNEVQFVVETALAPTPSAPKGTITNATPNFQWNALPGVSAYWIIVSSTPFVVRTDSLGNPSVQGANIVWDFITTSNSAQYGTISPHTPFTQSAIPLISGTTYYYTILNMYDQTNIAYASTAFGGITTFTYQSSSSLGRPNLVAPAANATFFASPTIRFQWDVVPNANSYTVYLFNRVTQFAGSNQEIDLPLWNGTTTNNVLDFPARLNLIKGKYVWFVVPNSITGAGSASLSRVFQYEVPTSKYRVRATSSLDNTALTNFEFQIASTTSGYTPSVPYVVSNSSSFSDSIPHDTYRFNARKQGFLDTTVTVSLSQTTQTEINFIMRPLPSIVSGSVRDQSNASVGAASVRFTNNLTGAVTSGSTTSGGSFSLNLPKGSYSVVASKAGYISNTAVQVNVDTGQIVLSTPIVIRLDAASFSGKVVNDENAPVQLAIVKATKGTEVQTTTTNSAGDYAFNISSGSWIVEVTKTGFVSPAPRTLSLTTGGNLLNQNFVLVPRANQVTGFVYQVTGSTGQVPVSGITVTATPVSGQTITAITGNNGQYTLSLKNGSYTISTSQSGFTPSNAVQLTLSVAQTVSGVDFTLTPNPSSISGNVSALGGGALAGATVSVQGVATTTTLSTGTYTLSLPAGTHSVTVTRSGYVTPQSVSVTVNPGQSLSGINFQMSANAGVMSGRVSSAGQPLPGASVTATNGVSTFTVVTNANGDYSFSLAPGTWRKFAFRQGFITSVTDTTVIGPGQTSSNNNFNLVQNTAIVRGTVRSNNLPLSGVTVRLVDNANANNNFSTVTSITGEYALTVEAGKAYTQTFSATGYATVSQTTATLAAGSSTTLNGTMNAVPSSVAGQVRVAGQALSGVTVQLVNPSTGAVIEQITTNLNGQYTVGAAAGSYRLRAFRAGYTRDSLAITLALGQSLTNINFNLNENFALVTGIVRSNAAVPLSGVVVNLTGTTGGATATTGSDGSYTLQRVLGGVYTLSFRLPGYADSVLSSFTLNDGQSRVVNSTLFALAGKISGTVTLAGGGAVSGATVTAVNAAGAALSAVSSASGAYEITGLATGAYTVTASRSGYRSSQSINVTLTTTALNGTANINDMALNNSVISGAVRDPAGNGILNAVVAVSGSGGSGNAVTNAAGEFTVSGLAPGTYSLTASAAGYATSTQSVNVTTTANLFIPLTPNTVRVTGTVLNQNGLALGFNADVRLTASDAVYTTTANSQGAFEFPAVSSGRNYRLYTEIFREGHANDSVNLNIAAGATSVPVQSLVIRVSTSVVSGNAGTDAAAITLVNNTTGETRSILSSSTGDYRMEYLTSGSYTISVVKTGFTFSPATQNFALDGSNSQSINFTATVNSGTVNVSARTNTSAPLENVSVTLVSNDGTRVFSGATSTTGELRFQDIPSGGYILRASLSGYSSVPAEKAVTVASGGSISESFVLTRNTSSIAGVIRSVSGSSTTALGQAQITIRNTATGQLISAESNANGAYTISNVPPGEAVITASKTGYVTATETVTIAAGASLNNKNYDLVKASAVVTGRVLFGGAGVANITVNATSSNTFTTVTNTSGNFTIDNLPVSSGATDTTTYIVTISGAGLVAQSKIIRFTASQIGTSFSAGNFILPSGQITFNVTDGITALPNVKITLIKPDGSENQNVTSNTGRYASSDRLPAGNYRFAFELEGYMVPDESEFVITLASDTTKVTRNIGFRYKHVPVTRVLSDSATRIAVNVSDNITTLTGTVFYRNENQSEFSQLNMSLSNKVLSASIPAQNSLEPLHYYIRVRNNASGVVFGTEEYVVTPLASGVLTQATLEPSLDNIILRKDDEYELRLNLRDGTNKSLTSEFTGANPAGRIRWESSAESGLVFSFPDPNDSTRVLIKPTKNGSFILSATALFKGSSVRVNQSLQSIDIPLSEIKVSSGTNKLANTSAGLQFAFTGLDTLQRSVYLGSSLQWSLTPAAAGTISNSGFFKPADSTFIGNVTVTAEDKSGGKKGSADLSVYAQLLPTSVVTLTNKEGLTLNIQSGSVPGPVNVTINKPAFGPGKKNYNPVGKAASYVVSDRQYAISYEADFALKGDSLLKNATLKLPVDKSLDFFDGGIVMGFYDVNTNEWSILSASLAKGGEGEELSAANDLSFGSFRRFGEYSMLTENQPLGLKYVAVMPSPFSPEVSPAMIGYFLNSAKPPASVTIRIFNMRGELVRTLLQDDLQFPGRYGSSAGIKQITWDGKTDDGLMARNGRYIIQIIAKDGSGEVKELESIVLVK